MTLISETLVNQSEPNLVPPSPGKEITPSPRKRREEDFSAIISNLRQTDEDEEMEEKKDNADNSDKIGQHLDSVAKSEFSRDRSGSLRGILRMDISDDIIKFSQVANDRPPSPHKSVRFKFDEDVEKPQPVAAGSNGDRHAHHNSFANVIREFEGITIKPQEPKKMEEYEFQPISGPEKGNVN